MTLAVVWPWSIGLLVLAVMVGLGAGVVRGFAGFGFAALVVAGLSPFAVLGPIVTAAVVMETVASALLVKKVAPQVDRRWLAALVAGNAVCVPLGVAALAWMPQLPLRIVVSSALLAGAVGMRLAQDRALAPTAWLRGVAGAGSGLLNGLSASGGVVAAMLMAATRPAPAALRATLITFLLYASAYVLLCACLLSAGGGPLGARTLLGADTLRWVALLLPCMLLGMRFGTRAFGKASADTSRSLVLNLLIAMSAAGLLLALFQAMQPAPIGGGSPLTTQVTPTHAQASPA